MDKYTREVWRAESENMAWDDWIAKTVAEAPPLSSEQIKKLRALFGLEKSSTQGCTKRTR